MNKWPKNERNCYLKYVLFNEVYICEYPDTNPKVIEINEIYFLKHIKHFLINVSAT